MRFAMEAAALQDWARSLPSFLHPCVHLAQLIPHSADNALLITQNRWHFARKYDQFYQESGRHDKAHGG
jgi:hypothetical protein